MILLATIETLPARLAGRVLDPWAKLLSYKSSGPMPLVQSPPSVRTALKTGIDTYSAAIADA